MIFEIDDDEADKIVSKALIQSYIWIKADLKTEKANPGSFHEDDVEIWKRLVPALEEVGKHFTYDWEGEVKKAKKKL
jgi:hypothetical protein